MENGASVCPVHYAPVCSYIKNSLWLIKRFMVDNDDAYTQETCHGRSLMVEIQFQILDKPAHSGNLKIHNLF
jgi:hypothetical protein